MITFRLASPADTPVNARCLAELFREVEHDLDADDIEAVFGDIESHDRHSTLLALDSDGDIAGIITVAECISISAGGVYGVINELYVMPAWRSEGVGRLLVSQVVALAEERQWRRIEVTTPGDDFSRTLHFYEKEGFYRIGPRYCRRITS